MTAFEDVQILEVTLTEVGKNAMWNAALKLLPVGENDEDRPVIAKATDARGNQISITRINGIPMLVETSLPERLCATAERFQSRLKATPAGNRFISHCHA